MITVSIQSNFYLVMNLYPHNGFIILEEKHTGRIVYFCATCESSTEEIIWVPFSVSAVWT